MVTSLALSSFGYICVGVSTEEDALLAVHRMALNVIAYECHRPDGTLRSGFARTLRDRARSASTHVLLVAISFLDEPSSLQRANEGIDQYLTKPLDVGELNAVLSRPPME